MKSLLAACALLLAFSASADSDFEFSGRIGGDLRLFTQSPRFSDQQGSSNLSLFFEPEFYWAWNDSDDTFTFRPFIRIDQHDDERTHGDIRELYWTHVGEDWEIHTGIRKVYWGVTEFQHLVDTINQTDGVEDMDGEEKLGQPMINLSLVRDWGIIDLYLLPGFRERTYPGQEGRLRTPLRVDTGQALHESSAGEKLLDVAVRWSHTYGDYYLGLHWFHGTNRDPLLLAGLDAGGNPALVPYYEQMDQFGLDFQATLDEWLWKLELIRRDADSGDYWAAQGGFEYTLTGVNDSVADLGLLMEYGWDERGQNANSLFQRDLFLGARLAMNDIAGTEILAGIGYDLDHESHSLMMEASRRIGGAWKISLDARLFSAPSTSDPAHALHHDDHLQLTLERFF